MKKRLLICIFLLLIVVFPVMAQQEEEPFQVLQMGSSCEEVRTMKKRLQELGYYRSTSFTKKFTEDTRDVLMTFQQVNGLEQTGTLTEETYILLYSDTALPKPTPTPEPLPTPRPTPVVDWPDRDGEGYLASGDEFVYENDEEGLWAYLSPSLQITIIQREDTSVPLIWFETDILMRGEEQLKAVEVNPDKPGTRFRYPFDIATDNHFVLGFSDDFYGDRIDNHNTVGVVIREGEIYSASSYDRPNHHFPNLDMLAQYPDGSLKAYQCGTISARELAEAGAVNVFSFGPVMITDGEISSELYTGYYTSNEPRQCLGMIEPGHYFLLSIQGRMETSRGTTLLKAAQIMTQHGVTEALNLDGGNTMALVFRGRMINKLATWKNKKFVRTVTSLIGVGYTENMS